MCEHKTACLSFLKWLSGRRCKYDTLVPVEFQYLYVGFKTFYLNSIYCSSCYFTCHTSLSSLSLQFFTNFEPLFINLLIIRRIIKTHNFLHKPIPSGSFNFLQHFCYFFNISDNEISWIMWGILDFLSKETEEGIFHNKT